MSERCLLLELPAEIRLQIYEKLFNQKAEPLLIFRNDASIQQPKHRWFVHPGPALLKTCKTIYSEASPVMYDKTNFRVQIYIGDGWPQYQDAGPVDSSNPLLRQVQHVDITMHLVDSAHIDPALARLGILATALEEAKADLKTSRAVFKAVTSYNMEVNRELVGRHRNLALQRLGERYRAGDKGTRLFRKLLMEGVIVAIN